MSQLEINLASSVYRDRAADVAFDAERRRIDAERGRLTPSDPNHHWSLWEGLSDLLKGFHIPRRHAPLGA